MLSIIIITRDIKKMLKNPYEIIRKKKTLVSRK